MHWCKELCIHLHCWGKNQNNSSSSSSSSVKSIQKYSSTKNEVRRALDELSTFTVDVFLFYEYTRSKPLSEDFKLIDFQLKNVRISIILFGFSKLHSFKNIRDYIWKTSHLNWFFKILCWLTTIKFSMTFFAHIEFGPRYRILH